LFKTLAYTLAYNADVAGHTSRSDEQKGKLTMLLENKVCVIYGAGGAIGGAIARRFAREEARVFLTGRPQAKLDQVADERIRSGLSNAKVAVRLVHGCTTMERAHA
jgi:shikimate 5-dehydrogenase